MWQGPGVDAGEKVQALLKRLNAKFIVEDEKKATKFANYVKGLGFDSVDELSTATAGQPVPVYSIHLDKLRAIKTGEDIKPWSVLTETGSAILPILVQKEIRSSATAFVVPDEHTDKPSVELGPLGSRNDTQLLREIKTRSCKCFVIRASALDRQFLGEGDKANRSFKIRVMADGPGKKLKKGDYLDAEEVFAELSREAKRPGYDLPDRPEGGRKYDSQRRAR